MPFTRAWAIVAAHRPNYYVRALLLGSSQRRFGRAEGARAADLYNGTVPFLTCVGVGWKDSMQKEEFIQKYKDALEDEDEDFEDVDEWLSEQGFTEKESMYYIEDGVTVALMTGEDELDPMV